MTDFSFMSPMFEANPKARADLAAGALYAFDGGAGWIYYGQYGVDGTFACFRFRSAALAPAHEVLRHDAMFRLHIVRPTDALREGRWLKMGRHPLHPALRTPFFTVQWPVGTLTVTVWRDNDEHYETRVEDPRIQDFEVMGVWAPEHLYERVVADFGAEAGAWHVGGPIWRERRVMEETARRFPDAPGNQLPADWVPFRVQ